VYRLVQDVFGVDVKILIILIASVKFPSSEHFYLTAESHWVRRGNIEDLENAKNDFFSKVNADGFAITNFLIYVVPREKSLMRKFQDWWKQRNTVRCDGGADGQ
jgi:hypothetical protein